MPIVADVHPYVIGVDTHSRTHTYAILAADTGALLHSREFPTTGPGLDRAIAWASRRTDGDLGTLWVIEGCAAYGAQLTSRVTGTGYVVVEAPRMDKRAQAPAGKSDPLDAQQIARSTLPLAIDHLRHPRAFEGIRSALQILLTARDHMTRERTAAINALTALLRTQDLGIDARRSLTKAQLETMTAWRERREDIALAVARRYARDRARQIRDLGQRIKANERELRDLVGSCPAAALTEETGFGPVNAAVCYVAWSHPGRVRDEAAFASLAGVSPLPAASGKTNKHRLNRYGDRQLNRALYSVILNRSQHDQRTRDYIATHVDERHSTRDVRRILKRYLARHVYRLLNQAARQLQPV
ncbi:IS110 family transposase [Brachybacterium vulturis]|uniref:IS110 family transposase n=1 Tax=Brachybacterium vulturis TaxID=2017484 RepID=A0A291GQH4_9MICO|nr:IS110 family transposase [Brachybacterium vulturis]ATG52360.1 IS110 family transposase [Brachybacterium vulturis]